MNATERACREHRLVESVSDERRLGDGVWLFLKPGYFSRSTGTTVIHEPSWSAALQVLRRETEAAP